MCQDPLKHVPGTPAERILGEVLSGFLKRLSVYSPDPFQPVGFCMWIISFFLSLLYHLATLPLGDSISCLQDNSGW